MRLSDEHLKHQVMLDEHQAKKDRRRVISKRKELKKRQKISRKMNRIRN